MSIRYVKGWVACVQCISGRFPTGHEYLYGGPFPTERYAKDWASAINGSKLVRIECNEVPHDRIVGCDRELMEDVTNED